MSADTPLSMSRDPSILGGQTPSVFEDPVLTRFTKLVFQERFNKMVIETGEYDGHLPAAFETAEALDVAPVADPPTEEDVNPNQQQQISSVAKKLRNAGISSVIIEAAHVYMHDDLHEPGLRQSIVSQAKHAAALTEKLKEDQVHVRQMLFVDDYNPPAEGGPVHSPLEISELIELVASAGYTPELLFREGSMVALAKEMIAVLKERQGLVISDSPEEASEDSLSRLMLSRRNTELYRATDDMVSCAMLDAALTVVKLRYLGEGVVNILPKRPESQPFSYKGQQRKMRSIIGEHLNVRVLPVFNLFTGTNITDEIAAGAHNVFRKPQKD